MGLSYNGGHQNLSVSVHTQRLNGNGPRMPRYIEFGYPMDRVGLFSNRRVRFYLGANRTNRVSFCWNQRWCHVNHQEFFDFVKRRGEDFDFVVDQAALANIDRFDPGPPPLEAPR